MSAQFTDAFERVVYGYTSMGLPRAAAMDSASHKFAMMGIDFTKGYAAMYDIENDFEVPMSVGFGLMYSPSCNLRLGLDFEWINWSKSAEKMKLTLKNGQNQNINLLLGQGGVGQPDLVVDFPLDWKDSYLIKIGGEYDIKKTFTVRAGYAFGTNPIPQTTVIPIIPAVIEHHITAGTTFNITDRAQLNLGLEYGVKKDVLSDTPNKVATEYNGSSTGLQNFLGHISVTYYLR